VRTIIAYEPERRVGVAAIRIGVGQRVAGVWKEDI